MSAKLYRLKPQRPAVSAACQWSAAIEAATTSHIRLIYSWQRIWLRTIAGV